MSCGGGVVPDALFQDQGAYVQPTNLLSQISLRVLVPSRKTAPLGDKLLL